MPIQKNIIDQVFPETLKILTNLIKFQTVSGTSNLELIKYCEKKLDEVGKQIFFETSQSQKEISLENLSSFQWELRKTFLKR